MRTNRGFILIASTLLALTGCANNPSPTNTPSNSATPTGTRTEEVIYFVADTPVGLRLYSEIRMVTVFDDEPLAIMQSLIDDGIAPRDPDFVNLWADANTTVRSVVIDATTATIDLHYGHLNVGSEAEARALDQIMYTLVGYKSRLNTFVFTVDGKTVETLAGHVDISNPIALSDGLDVLADVQIDKPQQSQVFTGNVTITGMACVFEATVAYQLSKDGTVVKDGNTMAAEGCPTRSAWSLDLGTLAAGNYTIRAFELSEKDGSLLAEDTKDFVVG
jgi:hypothetical protein